MDGNTVEHSDSDSGESWTLLEATPAYANQVLEFPESATELTQDIGDSPETNCEKDEDTDGISIISDSDHESLLPCDITSNRCLVEESYPAEHHDAQYFSVNPSSNNDNHKSIRSEDDFLGDNSGKHKTYVHKRNKRLSTVLNIIVLGSVITAAGVAIGHMWGAKDDCIMQNTPSVNKILSNLYKLQEENSYLRSKLKELTLLNNIQIQNRKYGSDKVLTKQNKCKKVFEEPINNKNVDKYTKCVDTHYNSPKIYSDGAHISESEYEKEFIGDINKLKHIYEQNKSWLDVEVSKRINNENQLVNELKNNPNDINKVLQEKKLEKSSEINDPHTAETDSSEMPRNNLLTEMEGTDINKSFKPAKVSYAGSLQSDFKTKNIEKRDISKHTINKNKEQIRYKPQLRKNKDTFFEPPLSEDELIKDNRYVGHRRKQEIKKFDRQKSHKKQKRNNKYEQWEMKVGYMKNYDDLSISSQDSDFFHNQKISKLNENVETVYDDKSTEIKDKTKSSRGLDNVTEKHAKDNKNNKQKDASWYQNRAVLRREARTKLQQELLGDSSSNSAGWYFRRMQRREQCRDKDDNGTHRKFLKRNMNFKTKH